MNDRHLCTRTAGPDVKLPLQIGTADVAVGGGQRSGREIQWAICAQLSRSADCRRAAFTRSPVIAAFLESDVMPGRRFRRPWVDSAVHGNVRHQRCVARQIAEIASAKIFLVDILRLIAGIADQDLREGHQPRPLCRIPDGRGRDLETPSPTSCG